MKIDILNLKDGITEYFERLNEVDLDLQKLDFRLKDYVDVHIIVEKSANKVKIEVLSKFTLVLSCSRCLEEFSTYYENVDVYFIRPGKEEFEEEKTLTDEDVYTLFTPTQEVDTNLLVRDSIILSTPMKPLCREDCKGLCPQCGINLNYSDCVHVLESSPVSDWRKKLEEIKKKLAENK